MKTACLVISIVLCVMFIILPVFELVAWVNDINFTLYSELVIPIIQTVLAVGSAIAIFIMRPEFGTTEKIFCNLLTPFALLNALCFIDSNSIVPIILAVVWCIAAFVIYVKFVDDGIFKAASAVCSVLLAIAFIVGYLVVGVLGNVITERDVTDTVKSSDGTYVAEISIKKSVLGEEMEVRVYPSEPKTRAFIGAYTYEPVSVYDGEPHETQTADIVWKDNSTLVINGEEHKISFE